MQLGSLRAWGPHQEGAPYVEKAELQGQAVD